MTLRTGPDPHHGPNLSAASALLISSTKGGRAGMQYNAYAGADEVSEKSSEQLAIYTEMNVDKLNSKTMPKQRVLYLNSNASNKNLAH
jgi:hypothetical protein